MIEATLIALALLAATLYLARRAWRRLGATRKPPTRRTRVALTISHPAARRRAG